MKEYLALCNRILREGEWVYNDRTKTRCLTVINADLEYDVENNVFPLVTTRKSYYKQAIMEMIGYLRGYDSAEQFRSIGVNTWNKNANENASWIANPNRKGTDDMGRVYGVQGRGWQKPKGGVEDQLMKIYDNLRNGIDDRGEILSFWNVGEFELGCLRPCVYDHQFSILDGGLYLNSKQRSCDVPLGLNFNQVQCFALLALMARVTGLKPKKAYHKIINAHLYENQVELMQEQVTRKPYKLPKLVISNEIQTMDDILTKATADHFTVVNYFHHEPIAYPFTT